MLTFEIFQSSELSFSAVPKMKPLAFLPVASLCSALVIPGQDVVLDVFSKDPFVKERASYAKILSSAKHFQPNKSPWCSLISSGQSDEPLIQSALSLGLNGLSSPSMQILQAEDSVPSPGPDPDPGYPDPIPPPPPGNPPDGEPPRRCPIPDLCPGSSTIWELLSQSSRTSRLADLMRNDKELVELLNSTSENYTIFAPTNKGLDHQMGQLDLPSMGNILRYHIVPGRLSLEELRAYIHQTLPTILNGTRKGKGLDEEKKKKKKKGDKHKHKHKDEDGDKDWDKDLPQRLRIDALRDSITVNGASEIVTGDIVR